MAKKRGGVAGFWDRNKGAIKTLAPIAAGFIPGVGPLVGAALGAAMNGFDRPGESGIGFDVGRGALGAASGYGGAKLGAGIKSGVGKLYGMTEAGKTAAAGKTAMSVQVPTLENLFAPTTSGAGSAFGAGASGANVAPMLPPPAPSLKGPGLFGKGGYIERNERLLGGAAKGIGSALEGRSLAAQQAQANADALALKQQEFDYRKQQDEEELARRRRAAELLMPMFAGMQSRQSSRYFG